MGLWVGIHGVIRTLPVELLTYQPEAHAGGCGVAEARRHVGPRPVQEHEGVPLPELVGRWQLEPVVPALYGP